MVLVLFNDILAQGKVPSPHREGVQGKRKC